MIEFPPIPSWDGLHPLIIHFPVGLLLVAPVFIILSLVSKRSGRAYAMAALILMVLGTAAVFVAVSTGEAAGQLAERTPEINRVLTHHEELAETTRIVFSVLTAAFALILFGPRLLKRELGRVPSAVLTLIFLVLYMAGALVLSNTAHNGGTLVHGYGVHALVDTPAATGQAAATPSSPSAYERD